MKINNIFTAPIQTPLKLVFAASFRNELILFVPYEEEFINKKLQAFKNFLKANEILEDKNSFRNLQTQIDEYFSKKREIFTIPLKLIGTSFQIKTWEALLKIPYGKTISYKEEAKMIENEKAFRAVANANGKNNLSIIVPFHRVISADGKIGGYTGGVEIKEFLINLEK